MQAGNAELNDDVLGVVLLFVGTRDAAAVRATCRHLRDVAARVAWRDEEALVHGRQLRRWRACFPSALAVSVKQARDVDLPWLRGVRTLRLEDCPGVTGEVLQHLESPTTLAVDECPDFTDEGLRHLGHITELVLIECGSITDEGLRHLGRVETLALWGCAKATDEGLRHLGGVATLSLYDCTGITDEGLRHLGRGTALRVSHCPAITDDGLARLSERGVNVQRRR